MTRHIGPAYDEDEGASILSEKPYIRLKWTLGLFAIMVFAALSACKPETKEQTPPVRPVRTVTTAKEAAYRTTELTGDIQAQTEVNFAFRLTGRVIERPVQIGDHLVAGQLLAKLDPQQELNELRSARANLSAAEGQLAHAQSDFDRQNTLMQRGFAARAVFDRAQQALRSAVAQVDDAEARVKVARDRVGFTELKADSTGIVTTLGAEPGEVVQAGQMIVRAARQDGRDAVFEVPAQLLTDAPSDPVVTVRLVDDPAVTATGRVREVAPQADPVTRTFRVRVGLIDPPAAMRLGSTVIGKIALDANPAIIIPASALTRYQERPAVWIVDPQSSTVAMRNIEIGTYDPGTITVAHGLDVGEIVVTAGVQALHPGQKVRLSGPDR